MATYPYRRAKGPEREKLIAKAVAAYECQGGTINTAAAAIGRSYGFARTLLLEGGVQLKKSWTVNRTTATAAEEDPTP